MSDSRPDEVTRLFLAYHSLKGVGSSRFRKSVSHLREIQSASLDALVTFTSRFQVELGIAAFSKAELESAWAEGASILESCKRHDISIRIVGDSDYPAGLLRLKNPPAMLFTKGAFADRIETLAIVGTREATPWGIRTAWSCAKSTVKAGGVVVSGLALGIDSAAHEGAIEGGGVTWAVLAHGLDRVYPAANRELAERVLASGGALLSEYPPGEPPHRSSFVERDRIQAALARSLLLIESGVDGGAMHTVRFAKEIDVPVWVTFPQKVISLAKSAPTSIQKAHQGPWKLIQDGAHRVTTQSALIKLVKAMTHEYAAKTRMSGELF